MVGLGFGLGLGLVEGLGLGLGLGDKGEGLGLGMRVYLGALGLQKNKTLTLGANGTPPTMVQHYRYPPSYDEDYVLSLLVVCMALRALHCIDVCLCHSLTTRQATTRQDKTRVDKTRQD